MFLKRLEIVGFKSFAEQMTVEFVKGVTAVVGPNGSGKSNISDGIRWVLGEQSAKSLRGSKMQDIIFAGSDTRKPLNFAEISLVLDNEDQHIPIDYSEVSVTRRVYRSGESEYLLNRQPCRLKDIVDLFMDSGLGREAYSIIGQGKVEEILSSKAEDRRVIFEEAAGVLKYKTRKQQAEKRLDDTQENLNRVEDILHELEGQVEPLKIQASVAKDYLEKKKELEQVEIAVLVYDIDRIHTEWNKAKEALDLLKEQHRALEQQISEKEQSVQGLKQQIAQLDEEAQIAQQQLLSASETLEKREGRRDVLKERLKNAAENREQLLQTIREGEEKVASLKVHLAKEEEAKQKAYEQMTALEAEIRNQEKALHGNEKELEETVDRLKSDYIELLNEQASLRNETRYLEEQLQQLQQKQERLIRENEAYFQKRKELEAQEEQERMQFEAKEKQLHRLVDEYRNQQRKVEQVTRVYEQKEKQLYEAYQLIQRLTSRKDVLEEMQADFSGFFQGVKEVLKARHSTLKGIVGAVAELVTVPKPYETAIEIALGGGAQHIVVESEQAARQAIQYLKQQRFGRATFLPLPVMKGRELPAASMQLIQEHDAFVGIASELVSFDQRFTPVIRNLLGHVIVAKSLEGANAIARLLQHRYRIVTLEGDVVNPGGSMTGGSVKQKQTPLLGRQRELEELTDKLKQLEKAAAKLEQEVKQQKNERTELQQLIEDLRLQGEAARAEVDEAKETWQAVTYEVKAMRERLSLVDREHESFTDEETRIRARLAELKQLLTSAEQEASQMQQTVAEIEGRLKQSQSSKEERQSQLTELKIQLATAKERYGNIEEQRARIAEQLAEEKEKLRERKETFQLLETELSQSTSGELSLDEQIEKSRQEKSELSEHVAHLQTKRKELGGQLEAEEQLLADLGRKRAYMSESSRDAEVKVNRLDVELDNRLNQLRDEYELSYDLAKVEYPLMMEIGEARTKVKLIKRAIEELGTVNLGAIEEYERVSERYEFLKEQQADLVEAKETLHNVIEEMDEEMTKRFHDSFTEIQAHFRVVFKELFGGGEADLVLTEPDQLLTTGVDIMARPPGKKRQHLGLLSGGERALTAIALLFSILRFRPVPFCVLDEVEAALDEANVSRFAKFLKDFSDQTQFIVITHRKGTMEEADVLYGVTMQESGVSRVISVKLEETKELIES
ncbi:chromosome segregation protein SMC [Halalkalibacterium halodurans]|uniref:chromosome segregation protein SMC n=1 Tax=Halalkalibacterium halodurans TaxID=86665 RepID=UPI002E23A599|nr:chromosome segregation protein SMC [Halalkalibacterium halodurans]MED3646702.1 chromosome segregation protein SMC [Halalkalibacterium halodurans]MED4161563.1 chromosome segregation protein SMC [Halalkalibacterium halodurans]